MADQPKPNTFCWNELATPDSSASGKFYTALFGWTTERLPAPGMTYTLFKQDGKDVGGMLQMTAEWAGVKPHWMAYVAVEDVDACAKKIPELGGKVCVPPTDISVGRFAVVEDPTGAAFSIITLKG
jgi:predicted enzyme related to lactoylglutathione lyase